MSPVEARIPIAIGKSKAEPSLRTSAGARVDRNTLLRKRISGIFNRSGYALFTLPDSAFGQSNLS